jgi:hypothetical protein
MNVYSAIREAEKKALSKGEEVLSVVLNDKGWRQYKAQCIEFANIYLHKRQVDALVDNFLMYDNIQVRFKETLSKGQYLINYLGEVVGQIEVKQK